MNDSASILHLLFVLFIRLNFATHLIRLSRKIGPRGPAGRMLIRESIEAAGAPNGTIPLLLQVLRLKSRRDSLLQELLQSRTIILLTEAPVEPGDLLMQLVCVGVDSQCDALR